MHPRFAANWCDSNPHCRGNLGIPRTKMPQIKKQFSGSFLAFLAEMGATVRSTKIPARDLHPIQKNIIPDMVEGILERGWHRKNDRPMWATSDNYILDGHHRWAAWLEEDPDHAISVLQINKPVRAVLALARAFPEIQYSSRKARLRRLMALDPSFRQDFEEIRRRVLG